MFKEFRIGDLFDSTNGDTDLKKDDLTQCGVPLVTSGLENNGIAGLTDKEAKIIPANTITVDMFGNAFFRDHAYKMVTHARVFALLPKFSMNIEIGLYFASQFAKYNKFFSYNNMCSFKKVKDKTLQLPVIESSDSNHTYTVDDIDWQYMQDRIAELEQDRIAELEAYLVATGLDDYELTAEDKAVLGGAVQTRAYRLGEVFSVENVNKLSIKGKSYVMDRDIVSKDGTTPYIAAISINNGITGYSHYPANNTGDCITLSTTADSSNTVFYQEDPFIGRQQIAGIRRADEEIMGRYVGSYIAAVIRKLTRQFNYANKLTKEYLKNCDIALPVIESSDPNHNYTVDDIDWQYMEQYIRAMEKVAIADVVKYKDKVIATTKQVVVGQEEEKEE